MKLKTNILAAFVALVAALAGISCSDSKSYAELLTNENHYVNNFLADQRVINTVPTDSTFEFECGPDAPYYRMDEDGNIYMQVVKHGTGAYARDNELIYFRFTRWPIAYYKDGEFLASGEGNDENMSNNSTWFRYNNYSLESSYQWGSGIQVPLKYLPVDCEVNIVIKSQYGVYDEMSYVQPYLYSLRYYLPQT